jgi:L-histidine N-alpha-methyltransferase
MRGAGNAKVEVHLEDSNGLARMAEEILHGLTRTPKRLPSKYFYDDAGSALFEQITNLPEYYLTRAEQSLLEDRAADIARVTQPKEIVELGAGSAKKTRLLIDAGLSTGSLQRYTPLEVAQDMAERTARNLGRHYPQLEIHAVVGDFERHFARLPDGHRRLVAFLGSTIGNFADYAAVDLLTQISLALDGDDWFLLGTDLIKDTGQIEAAYNDSQGVTAEFNRNILNVINDQLGGSFNPRGFEHVAYFNEKKSRIETYLRSVRDQSVQVGLIDLEVEFAEGEMMRTEVSCKYSRESVEDLLRQAGLELKHWFVDPEETFALSLSNTR